MKTYGDNGGTVPRMFEVQNWKELSDRPHASAAEGQVGECVGWVPQPSSSDGTWLLILMITPDRAE